MSDDPFGDLDAAIGEQEQADDESELSEETTQEPDSSARAPPDDDRPATGSVDEPAFEFSEAVQRPLYAREASWDTFEDALDFDVQRALRDNDLRDIPKRELHDAVLRVVADHTDEVAEALIEARRNR